MPREQQLAEIATEQWGLVTTAQARKIGLTPQTMAKMARAGSLVRLVHGVYRLSGSPIDMHEGLRAAWLALDPSRTATERILDESVDIVSHRSAALLLGLGDLDADRMEFTVPLRRQTRRSDVRLHRAAVGTDDWALAAGLPAATPLRVIADLAATRIDRGHLATVVRDAILKHALAMDITAAELARHARGYGAATGDGQGLLTLLLREAGIPRSTVDIVTRGAPVVAAAQLLRHAAGATAIDPTTVQRVLALLDQDALHSHRIELDPRAPRAAVASVEEGSNVE